MKTEVPGSRPALLFAPQSVSTHLWETCVYGSQPGASQMLVKNPPTDARDIRDTVSIPGLGRSPLEEEMATHSSILAGKCHGQRSLVGYHRGAGKSRTGLGFYFPHQGSSPLGPLQWEPRVLTPGPAGTSLASHPCEETWLEEACRRSL